MVDRTLSEAYEIVLDQLRKHNLSWVVLQIQEQVRGGKLIEKHAIPRIDQLGSAVDLGTETPTESRGARKSLLVSTEAFTESERLLIAIEAIEAAVIQSTAMNSEIFHLLSPDVDSMSEVEFLPDEYDESISSKESDYLSPESREILQLKTIICRIKEEVALSD